MFPRGRFAPERQTRMSVIRTQEKIFCEKCLEKGKLFSVWKLAKYKLCFMQTRCPLFEKILKTHFQFWNISSEKETIQYFCLFPFFSWFISASDGRIFFELIEIPVSYSSVVGSSGAAVTDKSHVEDLITMTMERDEQIATTAVPDSQFSI